MVKKMKIDSNKAVVITGGAGFIGFHLGKKLMSKGIKVIALDNLNSYYDVNLKKDRLKILSESDLFEFIEADIADKNKMLEIFKKYEPEIVVNLAAQAGVRYSIENPDAYINSNMIGFYNILECCRHYPVKHLVYASSSSVYGANTKVPFSTDDNVDKPVSLYAATKKSAELMAHCYSKLYGIPATGLRFFTVYGPFGRPDMAYFSFTKKILAGESIKVFNNGDLYRDFTYIDDIIEGIEDILPCPPEVNDIGVRYKIYNIGNNKPEKLMYFIECLEKALGKEAQKEYLPMQPGDVYQTYADVTDLINDFGFKPDTPLDKGLENFIAWYRSYYK